jgi:hypothetical protein
VAISFPAAPVDGQTFVFDDITYEYSTALVSWTIPKGTGASSNTVNTSAIIDGEVSTADIGASQVTMAKLAADVLTEFATYRKLDGSNTPTADQPMGNFTLTGLRAAAATGEAVRYDEFLTVQTINTTLSTEAIRRDGTIAMTAALDLGSQNITNLADPTVATHGANKNYVDTSITNLINAAPATLDTLNELAASLGDDADFTGTMTTALALRAMNTLVLTAGNGLTGGGDLTADRTFTVDVAADADVTAQTASKILDATRIIDEDTMVSNSAFRVPTQQSLVAYVTGNTFYGLDGTLTANRTVTGGANDLTFTGIGALNSSSVSVTDVTTGALSITAGTTAAFQGAGVATFGSTAVNTQIQANGVTYVWPLADGTAGQVIQTDAAGNLSFVSAASPLATADQALTANRQITGAFSLTTVGLTDLALTGMSGTAALESAGVATFGSTAVNTQIKANTVTYIWPLADGTVNQAIVTDAAGNLSFASVKLAADYVAAARVTGDTFLANATSDIVYSFAGDATTSVTLGANAGTRLVRAAGWVTDGVDVVAIGSTSGYGTDVRVRLNGGNAILDKPAAMTDGEILIEYY